MKLSQNAQFAIDQAHLHPGKELALLPEWYDQARQDFESYLETQSPLKHPLLSLQKKSVAHAIASKYTAIFDDMGAGKTAQALAVTVLGGHRHTIIVCPNNLKDNWVAEIQKFIGTPLSQIFIGKGQELVRMPKTLVTNFKFLIFNYEAAPVAHKTPAIYPSAFQICDHIIFDEAHAIKNALTKNYMCWYYYLAQRPPNQLTLLTGTPFDRYAGEMYAYLQLLDLNPSVPGTPFTDHFPNVCHFEEQFALPRGKGGTYFSYRAEKLPVIKNIWGKRPVRRNITDITEMPGKTDQTINLPDDFFPDVDFDDLIKKFKKALALMHQQDSGRKLNDEDSSAMGAVQKIRVQVSECKVPYTLDMAEKYLSTYGPVVVFFEFVQPMLMAAKMLREKGYQAAQVHGEMSDNDRRIAVEAFKEGGKFHFLFATFGTLSEGVNLQVSNTVIFNDIPWRPLSISQAERRVWRIGQTRHCFQVSILCRVDEIILNNIMAKTDYIEDMYGIMAHARKEANL